MMLMPQGRKTHARCATVGRFRLGGIVLLVRGTGRHLAQGQQKRFLEQAHWRLATCSDIGMDYHSTSKTGRLCPITRR
jgi:hypothetical protein